MNDTWWEKTVEYAFVVAAFTAQKCDFAAPLAGKHERLAGDATFVKASKFVLIEFKRNESEIPTEKSLFHDYEDAKSKLEAFNHHHIVFGDYSTEEPSRLELVAQTYFQAKRQNSALVCLNFGVTKDEFYKYLELLAELKKEANRGSGGHVSPEALSTVVGVSDDGKMVQAAPLYEYAPNLFPIPVYRHDPTPQFPSPGM